MSEAALEPEVLDLEEFPDTIETPNLDLPALKTAAQARVDQMTAAGRSDVQGTFSQWTLDRIAAAEAGAAVDHTKAASDEIRVEAQARLDGPLKGSGASYVRKTLASQVANGAHDA